MMSSDLPEEIGNLQIPDDQAKRQAVASLRGYIYQIYQSLNAWMRLEEDEILLLEVAEDFAVIAKNALKVTQVKDTAGSGSVTLNTKSVADTIKSLWEFQQANSNRNVYMTFLTTAEIGKERGLTFPDNHSGLAYWRVAAREGTDIEPIRQVLLKLKLPQEAIDFIRDATPDDLRERILRKIDWVCGEKDIGALEQAINERLIYFGTKKSCTPTDSAKARDSLIVAILRKVVQKSNRQLSRADFLRIFEKATSISLPVSQVREFIKIMAANQGPSVGTISAAELVLDATLMPLPPRTVDRHSLVEELVSDMGQSGAMWLHGSSGTGKTILAQFIARQSKYNWLLIQLRDCPSASALDSHLCRVLQTLQLSRIGGVILDDLPTKHVHSVRPRLSLLVNEIHRMDGSVIITSAKPPSPNVQDCFGENGPIVVNAPYLSRDEVAELVKLADGDAQKWASVVHSFYGPGHPQLVQARISGLRQRKWPDSELLAEFSGIEVAEIKDQRDSIRERLIDELPQNTRDLLYRLSFFAGYFDRDLAIAVGEVSPAINSPGEALEILIGPWVEVMANDRFRVSPLVTGAGRKILIKVIQSEIPKRIVDNLIARSPFPGDFLSTLLSHALISRHVQGLTWLVMAITHTPDNDRRMIAEHLFILPLLSKSEPIFKEDIRISTMLRWAQFNVAAWANKTELLPAIADQLIIETHMIDDKVVAGGLLLLANTTILREQSLDINPEKWLPLIEEMEKIRSDGGVLAEYFLTSNPIGKSLGNWTIPQFMFYIRATSLKSIDELSDLFSILNDMEQEHRKELLVSLNILSSGKRLLIDTPWLAESKRKIFNPVNAAGQYRQLAGIAEMWGDTDIAVECECARAVMLNEYADDPDGALVSIEQAEKRYSKNIRLSRERAKVYYNNGDYATSLVTIEKVIDAIPKDDHIEKAFACREAGISAAMIKDFTKASNFFGKASEAASSSTDNMRAIAIGLKGDQALAQFQAIEKDDALTLMQQAITQAEKLNPEAGINEKYCILALGNAILWMQGQVEQNSSSKKDFQFAPGFCSKPEPPDKIMEMASPPYILLWYQLALLEVMIGANSGIMDDLRDRTRTQKILSCELILNLYIMAKYVITVDIENFFSYLPDYVSKTVYMRENASSVRKENIHDLTDTDLSAIKPVDWTSDPHLQYAKDAILALAATAVCSNVKNIREQLLNHAGQNKKAAIALCDFIDCFEKQSCPEGEAYEIIAFHLGYLMNINTNMSPNKMFIVTYRLWEWLSFHTSFKNTVENVIANYLAQHWQKIIEHQRFNLQQPMIAVPDIEAAIGESAGGTVKIAKLLLAAEIAVKHKLDTNLRSKLKEHCLQNQKGDTS